GRGGALGAEGPGGGPGVGAGVPGAGVPGSGAPGAADKAPDFSSAEDAVRSFLTAVKNKDTAKLSEAVALRAEYEVSNEQMKSRMKGLKDENLPADEIDKLAQDFDGMQVAPSRGAPRSTGMRSVVVGKREENKYLTRTVKVRHEKDGWKVMEYTGLRTETLGPTPKKKKS